MAQELTVTQGLNEFLRAIGRHVARTKWWQTILWIIWIVLTVSALSAVFGSINEYETRPAWVYGIVFLVLLILGFVLMWRRGSSGQSQ
jgi:hypothetical protein